jgi:hypothetical protein
MAFSVSAASALWLENGAAIASNKLVELATHTEGTFLVEKETNLEILCSTAAGEDFLLLSGTTEAKGGVNFSGCKVWQNGKDISTNCKPVEPIKASTKAKLILHNSKNYILFEPTVAGGNFTQIKFNAPCALPEINNVKGSLVTECLTASLVAADCATEEKVHLLQPNEALFTGDKLTYGTKEVKLPKWRVRICIGPFLFTWSGRA